MYFVLYDEEEDMDEDRMRMRRCERL
jgi:hypothetical protein